MSSDLNLKIRAATFESHYEASYTVIRIYDIFLLEVSYTDVRVESAQVLPALMTLGSDQIWM